MYRILLADDDKELRYLYSKMKAWQKNGFVVSAFASNGKEALEILEKESFDMLVTDIKMPFVDGLDLVREIKKKNIQILPVLMSSYNEFEYARQGLVLGAFDFIVKPVTEKALTEMLERAKICLGEYARNRGINELILSVFQKYGIDAQNDRFLNDICIFLSENMGQDVTTDAAADAMKLNKDYFGKIFKKRTGMTFHSLYKIIKVEYAKLLIKNSLYKNYEISDMLGYSSPDYFAKIFKEVAGMTPSEYKNL